MIRSRPQISRSSIAVARSVSECQYKRARSVQRDSAITANDAVTLTTDHALELGSLPLPAGTYTLHPVQGRGIWELHVRRPVTRESSRAVGGVPMTMRGRDVIAPQLTVSIDDDGPGWVARTYHNHTCQTPP